MDMLANMQKQMADLQKQLKNYQRIQKEETPAGRNPNPSKAGRRRDPRYWDATDKISGLNDKISELTAAISGQREIQKEKNAAERARFKEGGERARKEAEKVRGKSGQSFKQTFPDLAELWGLAPVAAGAFTAAALRSPQIASQVAARGRASKLMSRLGKEEAKGKQMNPVRFNTDRRELANIVQKEVPQTALGKVGKAVGPYGATTTTGAVEGAALANLPTGYDALMVPEANPEKAAAKKYWQELPDGHPDKERARRIFEQTPDLNPARAGINEALKPENLKAKALAGALEGAGGALMGTTALKALQPGFRRPAARSDTYQQQLSPEFQSEVDTLRDLYGVRPARPAPAVAPNPSNPPPLQAPSRQLTTGDQPSAAAAKTSAAVNGPAGQGAAAKVSDDKWAQIYSAQTSKANRDYLAKVLQDGGDPAKVTPTQLNKNLAEKRYKQVQTDDLRKRAKGTANRLKGLSVKDAIRVLREMPKSPEVLSMLGALGAGGVAAALQPPVPPNEQAPGVF